MSGAPTDPTDLSVPSFERVSDISFDDDVTVLRVVHTVPIPDDDEGWDW